MKLPMIVGLAMVGDVARTAAPVPVDEPVLSNVPLVGNVILVEPVVVSVSAFAPEVVRFPPSVIALELATPFRHYLAYADSEA
ncbi:hypothetical protein PQQ84_18840 [Paraburkholderia strydomiana]|uniref:hypothetical protein n=1 Tax=Paraburkholderia strydomiana TaxID=1245417 RepID=UPI0038BBB069